MKSDEAFNLLLQQVGRKMLIKSHEYEVSKNNSKHPIINIPLSISVKGHLCTDGRYYMHGYNQLLPPDLPSPGTSLENTALNCVCKLQFNASYLHTMLLLCDNISQMYKLNLLSFRRCTYKTASS